MHFLYLHAFFLLYGVPGDLKRATNLSYFQSDIIDRPSLQIKANGYFMAHMSNLMCTFFLVLSLTLSFSVLFEPNDCLKIIATLLMEQSRTQLPYYVITFTKLTFSRKWPATYHCKNKVVFFLSIICHIFETYLSLLFKKTDCSCLICTKLNKKKGRMKMYHIWIMVIIHW